MELNQKELNILKDQDFLPMKALLCQKVEEQLAKLLPQLRQVKEGFALEDFPRIDSSGGKISKGENYNHFAYRVLDYPNVLSREDMFLFRSMMLWGDAYGFHFILAGRYLDYFGEKLLDMRAELPEQTQYAAHADPWVWHSTAEGWKTLSAIGEKELEEEQEKRKFLKLSVFLDLADYELVNEFASDLLATYLRIISA